jgi:uncharacterized membrane protein YphA (DoxX/SURF4 family)
MTLELFFGDPHLVVFCVDGLGLVFLVAAIAKFKERYQFRRTLRDQIGMPDRLARMFARLVPSSEAAIGGALISGVARSWAIWSAVMLLAIFSLVLITAQMAGKHKLTCNCFGQSSATHNTLSLVIRNLCLLAVGVYCALSNRDILPVTERVTLVLMSLSALAVYGLVSGLLQVSRYRLEIDVRNSMVMSRST